MDWFGLPFCDKVAASRRLGRSFAALMSRASRALGSDTTGPLISSATSVVGDTIIIKDLLVRNTIGVDSWERLKKQDILINVRLQTDLTRAGSSDELGETVNYSTVCKDVVDVAESRPFKYVRDGSRGCCMLTRMTYPDR